MAERTKSSTDVSPEILHVGKLLDKLAEGRIRIPRFQRPFVWRPEQMCDLLDSIQHRFPIGSILIWETDRRMESHRHIGPIEVGEPPDERIAYVLDGQQRLTTLLGALRLSVDYTGDWEWRIFYDLEKGIFYHPRSKDPKLHDLPVRALLGTFDFLAECRKIVEVFKSTESGDRAALLVEAAERVADVFRNYQVPMIRITDADLQAAVKIFARLNTRGRRMTPDQMVSALTYSEESGEQGFHLASEIDRVLEGLADQGFGDLDRVAVLRAVLAAAERDIYDTDWTNVVEDGKPGTDLREPLAACEQGLGRAVEFLRDEGVTSDRLLPYALQMVLLAEFFRNCPNPSPEVTAVLQRWFWVSSFTGWFATFNSSQAKIAVEEMRQLARGQIQEIETVGMDAPALPFPSRFDGRSARVRAFLLYLMSLNPLSLDTGEPLNAGQVLSQLGPKALRYILRRGLPKTLHGNPANRLLLGPKHKGQAKQALAEVPAGLRSEIFASHGIPGHALDLLVDDRMADFVAARQEHLIDGEREFMKQRRVTAPIDRQPMEPQIDIEGDGD